MEVKYLKAHNGKSQGDTEIVANALGKYMIVLGVCEEVKTKAKKEIKADKAK